MHDRETVGFGIFCNKHTNRTYTKNQSTAAVNAAVRFYIVLKLFCPTFELRFSLKEYIFIENSSAHHRVLNSMVHKQGNLFF